MNEQYVKYFISVNSISLDGKLPSGDPRWRKFTNSFTNCEMTPEQLLTAILDGHSYCCWLNGGRAKENFTLAQHIALDFDTDDERSTIDYLMSNPFTRAYASIVHTTPSHTPQTPRARVIFLLDKPVIEIAKYESMVQFMIDMFQTDQLCKDATRFFYGCKDGEMAFPAHELPIAHLRELYSRYAKREAPQPVAVDNWPTRQLPAVGSPNVGSDSNAVEIIEAFNKQHQIEHMLSRYGYTKVSNRTWSRPDKPDSAGVRIHHGENKTYNFSSNDPLYAQRNKGNQPSDPFDYYCTFEHGGDISAALKSLEQQVA